MSQQPILRIQSLGFPWPTMDPFLFCVYHDDAYPRGNAQFGPCASLAGRNLGQDFAGKDGWRTDRSAICALSNRPTGGLTLNMT